MDTGKGAFGGSGNADIAAMQKDIADLKSVSGATSSTITPTEAGSYTISATEKTIQIVNMKPATDLSAITVALPTGRVGQRLFVHCSRQIDSVTFTMPGGSVDNNMVMLSPGDSVDFTYSETNNWARGI